LWDERHCADARRHSLPSGLTALGDHHIDAALRRFPRLAHRGHLMDHLRTDVMRTFDQTCRITQGENDSRLRVQGRLEVSSSS
jgi:hypothetical protein